MLDAKSFLTICAGSGLLGLDATAALQLMLSRPLVVGMAVGWLLGGPEQGLAVGGLIEMLWVGGVPVGSLVPPDGTVAAATAAAVAVSLAGASAHPGAADAAGSLAVLMAVPAGWVGARGEIIQRHLASRLARGAERAAQEGRAGGLGAVIMAALGLAWLRGALSTALCLAVLLPAAQWLLAHFPADVILALQWCFWLFWLLGLAVVADHFWDRRGLKYAAVALILLALACTRAELGSGAVVLILVVMVNGLGLWRWSRALKGEATA